MKHARIIVASLAVLAPAIIAACVLADPPPIGQPPAIERPLILHDGVSPPLEEKILAPPTSTPLVFSVPVLAPPDQPLTYRVFVDLDKTTNTFTKLISVTNDGGATGQLPDAGDTLRVLGFAFPSSTPIDFTICHTFTFVVAYAFEDDVTTPQPPGGDQVTWFYEPVADCTYYDAAPPTYDASDGATE